MLHLQKLLLPLRGFASPVFSSLHRSLLSTSTAASAAAASPGHFAVEEYLVTTCGLTPEQATRASKYVCHRKSPANADAVLAFLAGPFGLSQADIAHVLARDARILNCSVNKTLKARLESFLAHGLSPAQIRRFVCVAPCVFRSFNINDKLGFWMPFMGSPENFLRLLKRNYYLLTSDLDKVIKPNIALLRESGLTDGDIAKLLVPNSRLLTSNPENIKAILVRADQLGVPRDKPMFREAVATASGLKAETMTAKLKFFGETLGWSHAEAADAVRANPVLLRCSEEKFRRATEFLTTVAGLDIKYILRRPTILMYSLECRLVPRHYVMKVLQGKGLMRKDRSFYPMVTVSEEMFRNRYIHLYKGVLPGLADAYEAACKGELPAGCAL